MTGGADGMKDDRKTGVEAVIVFSGKMALAACLLVFGLTMIRCGTRKADTVFLNGKVWTVNPDLPEARAVAVRKDRIVFVGSDAEAETFIGASTKVIDLGGRRMLPGFNDAHVHFSDGGFSLIQLKLRGARDRMDFARRIGRYAEGLPGGAWITGGNWDHEAWPAKSYPDRWLVDPVTPEHPILVNRLDGHVALANSLALHIAGITKDTPHPEGGYIEKDPKTGEPTGILKDTAMDLVSRHMPATPDSVRMMAIRAALAHAAESGVTSVQDVSPSADYALYEELKRSGDLTCRILAVFPVESHARILKNEGVTVGSGDALLRRGGLKCFADGSMGAGSALFYEPYTDEPATSGLGIFSRERLAELIAEGHAAGLQMFTHAIGDKANCWVLDAYESAIREHGVRGLRHRIEHAQVVDPRDLPRFAGLGVIASIQPSHCIDDMRWAEKRIGRERCANAYMYKSFYDAEARVAFGTDWPVEPLSPMLGLYAAVTREYPGGGPEGGWFPEQIISMDAAIRSYTLDAAYAEHQEQEKGSIEAGKLADVIVLEKDPFEIPARELLEMRVDLTMMGGRLVFDRR